MVKKILNKMAVKVSFYNSRYFDMHCKLLQHLINWKEILVLILKFKSLLESVKKSQNILWTFPYPANLSCCSNFVFSYAVLWLTDSDYLNIKLFVMAVKVSFYSSRYFDMHCKLLQHLINWKEILVTTTIDKHYLIWTWL
jgi:hypothetical protein